MSLEYGGPLVIGILFVLGAIALVGGRVAIRAAIAYRVRRTRPLFYLGSGLFVISVGMPSVWMAAYLATDNPLWCSLVASGALLGGLVLLLVSMETRTE